MRLAVIAVGRLRAGPEKALADDYLTRAGALGRKAGIGRFGIVELAESQAATPALRIAEEARSIAGATPRKAFTIVLDERGVELTSENFAALLRRHLDQGTGDLAFLIGGPDGHAPKIREAAELQLCLGAMTWPHRLVRVMLLEQIYRAVTIMVKHPYHRP